MGKQKSLSNISQVFLQDANIKNKIIKLIKIDIMFHKIQNIFEVGVGSGEITKLLINIISKEKYLGVEMDSMFAKEISIKFGIKIINQDFLTMKLEKLNKCLLFSAIPYHITTKVLQRFIENIDLLDIQMLAFIIELRTFNRLLIDKKKVFYTFRDFFVLKKRLKINRNCFSPTPHVDSIFSIWHVKRNSFLKSSKEYLEIIGILNNKRNKNIINNLKICNEKKLGELINEELLNEKFSTLNDDQKKRLIKIGIEYIKNKEKI